MNTTRDTFRNLTGDTSSQNSVQKESPTYALETENNKNSSEKLIQREPVEGTPFQIITIEQGTFIAIGNRRITEYTTKEECQQKIECQSWDLLGATIVAMFEIMLEARQ